MEEIESERQERLASTALQRELMGCVYQLKQIRTEFDGTKTAVLARVYEEQLRDYAKHARTYTKPRGDSS